MINGIPAQPGLFTFMAAITWIAAGKEVKCSGFVVSSTAIISAGHCLHSSKRDDTLLEANYSAVLGSPNRKAGQVVQLRAILHPKYNGITMDNDISILQPLNGGQLPMMNYIKPIFLPIFLPKPGTEVYAMGWGKTTFDDCVSSDGKTSTFLLYHKQKIEGVLNRFKQLRVEGFFNENRGSSTCQGDSGSPLVEIRNNQLIAVGILSTGDHNGKERYQQVAPHRKFILEHVPDAQFV